MGSFAIAVGDDVDGAEVVGEGKGGVSAVDQQLVVGIDFIAKSDAAGNA